MTVVGLPVPQPERYVTRAQLAEMMGVHVTTIDRLVKQGMPSETWGLRARRFRPSVAIAWASTVSVLDRARTAHEAGKRPRTFRPRHHAHCMAARWRPQDRRTLGTSSRCARSQPAKTLKGEGRDESPRP